MLTQKEFNFFQNHYCAKSIKRHEARNAFILCCSIMLSVPVMNMGKDIFNAFHTAHTPEVSLESSPVQLMPEEKLLQAVHSPVIVIDVAAEIELKRKRQQLEVLKLDNAIAEQEIIQKNLKKIKDQ